MRLMSLVTLEIELATPEPVEEREVELEHVPEEAVPQAPYHIFADPCDLVVLGVAADSLEQVEHDQDRRQQREHVPVLSDEDLVHDRFDQVHDDARRGGRHDHADQRLEQASMVDADVGPQPADEQQHRSVNAPRRSRSARVPCPSDG